MRKRTWTDEQLTDAVGAAQSVADVLRALGLRPVGGNYKSIKPHLERLGLTTDHFRGQAWSAGKKLGPNGTATPLDEILVAKSSYTSTYNLKHRLLSAGMLAYECVVCGLSEWLGDPLSLHLDHINGDNRDNRIENLRLLCPNCHSQTDTYCGKNVKKANAGEICSCGNNKLKRSKVCLTCETLHRKGRLLGRNEKIEWPSDDELLKMVETTSFLATGSRLGVSDNAVRKRLRNRGLLLIGSQN
jgi:hypothetical protein